MLYFQKSFRGIFPSLPPKIKMDPSKRQAACLHLDRGTCLAVSSFEPEDQEIDHWGCITNATATLSNKLHHHDISWGKQTSMRLHLLKILNHITKSNDTNLPPPSIPGTQRVDQMVVLGVTIDEQTSFKPHVDNIVSHCAQMFYALWVLKSEGHCSIALWDLSDAVLSVE